MNKELGKWVGGALATSLVATGCATNLAKVNEEKMATGPNILFILSDDHNYDSLACAGNSQIKTPHLDQLASEGVLFKEAHFRGAICGAPCMPSRAQLMTGRDLYEINREGSYISDEHETLPETLLGEGYDTFHTGKWHNGPASFARSFVYGENILFGGMGNQYAMPMHQFNKRGSYPWGASCRKEKDHATDLIANSAIEYIQNYESDRPFFAYVAFTAPHDPREAPQKYHEMYPPESIEISPDFLPMPRVKTGELHIRDEVLDAYPRTHEIYQKHTSDYYAMITHMDDAIGQIIATLKEKGLYENTIIIYSADNGLSVAGRHGLMGKQHVYDESIRIPLIFAGPGVPKGEVSEVACYLQDIFPTLCDLTGLQIPETVTFGRSLKPLFDGSPYNEREVLFSAYKTYSRTVKVDDWKLIAWNVDSVQTFELFNLADDPYEMNDLSKLPEYQEKVKELEVILVDEMKKAGDIADYNKPHWGFPTEVFWSDALNFFP